MNAIPPAPAANPRKTTTVRKLGPVDIAALRTAVLAIPEAIWEAENAGKPNKFEALNATRHIVFRFIDSPATGAGPTIARPGSNGAACWSRCWPRPSATMATPPGCSRG